MIPAAALRRLPIGMVALSAICAALAGCSVSPAEQAAIRKAWAEHDAAIAAECRRNNVGYAAGGCVAGGP
jgi:hypothetical protein